MSAGVNSNTIAALAAEINPRLRTITLAFDEYSGTADDEAPHAEAAAQRLRTDHTTIRIGRSEFEALLDDFLFCMDQPTIDGLNTYLVSYAAGKLGLKVALSELGGDELFGGYPSFWEVPALVKWGRRFSSLQPFGRLLQQAVRVFMPAGLPPKAAGLLSHSGNLARGYLLRRALFLEDELDLVLDQSWIDEGLERLATDAALAATLVPLCQAGAPGYAQMAALESCWYLRNQLLRDTDWSSMAHGVEVRVPFVDFTLLQALGPAIASSHPPTKHELARCMQFSQFIAERPKTGFTTPVRQWIVERGAASGRGLRGWSAHVHNQFRTNDRSDSYGLPLRTAA